MKTYNVTIQMHSVKVQADNEIDAMEQALEGFAIDNMETGKLIVALREEYCGIKTYRVNRSEVFVGWASTAVEVFEVIEAPVVEVVAEQVAVKTEQGTVTVDILAAATVEQVAEQVATDAYTAGCDAKFFARTHAARIAKAAGTALTTEVQHLITTVTRRTVDTLDTALMA
jgi:hypothetical protein